jgi:hypothetical protein
MPKQLLKIIADTGRLVSPVRRADALRGTSAKLGTSLDGLRINLKVRAWGWAGGTGGEGVRDSGCIGGGEVRLGALIEAPYRSIGAGLPMRVLAVSKFLRLRGIWC